MGGRTQKWIVALMDELDKKVDERTLAQVLEQCGRQCQSQSAIKKARSLHIKSKSTDEFLDKLGKYYKHLHKEGDKVYLVYPRCFCSQVNKIPRGTLSATYCSCSRGWAKALFEGALGKSIDVIIEKSIFKGDSECRLRVVL
jgi:predicted ArsR family transcriptional regulator